MKQAIMNARLKFSMLITSLLVSFLAIAQDEKKVDIDINTKSEDSSFLMQPWVWIVAGAVFILLLVALLRNNKSA
jgi:cell division protein FtsW (lipid II flippase)